MLQLSPPPLLLLSLLPLLPPSLLQFVLPLLPLPLPLLLVWCPARLLLLPPLLPFVLLCVLPDRSPPS
jgi:hypothetical protein